MIYPCEVISRHEQRPPKDGRWLEAIAGTEDHYLVLIRNAGSGVTSHLHAVLKSDYNPVLPEKEGESADEFL